MSFKLYRRIARLEERVRQLSEWPPAMPKYSKADFIPDSSTVRFVTLLPEFDYTKSRRRLRFVWSCSDFRKHTHRWQCTARLCGMFQRAQSQLCTALLQIKSAGRIKGEARESQNSRASNPVGNVWNRMRRSDSTTSCASFNPLTLPAGLAGVWERLTGHNSEAKTQGRTFGPSADPGGHKASIRSGQRRSQGCESAGVTPSDQAKGPELYP